VSKVAIEHKRVWHKYIGFVMWAIRELPNETTKCPPFLLVLNRLLTGPLSILKETWTGEREIPSNLGKSAADYLTELRDHMEVAHGYAKEQNNISQQRYVNRYNHLSRDKTFVEADKCLILHPDSTTSKVFSRWKGPADIIEVLSKNSYLVELDQKRYKNNACK